MKEYKYKINGSEYAVKINKIGASEAEVEVNGKSYSVELIRDREAEHKPVVRRPARPSSCTSASASPSTARVKGGLKAPLPGVILEISVAVGDEVKRGQRVAVLEAMKMENNILSERAGRVLEINVQEGEAILEGKDILIIG